MSTPTTTAPAAAKFTPPVEAAPAAKPAKPEISLDFIGSGAVMLASELAETTSPVRARNEKQQAMDKAVARLHGTWLKAGKPTTWEKMVKAGTVATYFVVPELVGDLKKMVTRAVAFHDVRARYGTSFLVTETHINKFKLPAEYLGREAVSLAIMDKRPRGTSDGKPASDVIKK